MSQLCKDKLIPTSFFNESVDDVGNYMVECDEAKVSSNSAYAKVPRGMSSCKGKYCGLGKDCKRRGKTSRINVISHVFGIKNPITCVHCKKEFIDIQNYVTHARTSEHLDTVLADIKRCRKAGKGGADKGLKGGDDDDDGDDGYQNDNDKQDDEDHGARDNGRDDDDMDATFVFAGISDTSTSKQHTLQVVEAHCDGFALSRNDEALECMSARGTFAGFEVESNDIAIDLNGQQRFSVIRVGSKAFIFCQGSANVAPYMVNGKIVLICNGVIGEIGRSSHQAIHVNRFVNLMCGDGGVLCSQIGIVTPGKSPSAELKMSRVFHLQQRWFKIGVIGCKVFVLCQGCANVELICNGVIKGSNDHGINAMVVFENLVICDVIVKDFEVSGMQMNVGVTPKYAG
eukprot:528355_1